MNEILQQRIASVQVGKNITHAQIMAKQNLREQLERDLEEFWQVDLRSKYCLEDSLIFVMVLYRKARVDQQRANKIELHVKKLLS